MLLQEILKKKILIFVLVLLSQKVQIGKKRVDTACKLQEGVSLNEIQATLDKSEVTTEQTCVAEPWKGEQQ